MENNANGKKPEMVDWYNPSQLLSTAVKTAISTVIGENADPRLITAADIGNIINPDFISLLFRFFKISVPVESVRVIEKSAVGHGGGYQSRVGVFADNC